MSNTNVVPFRKPESPHGVGEAFCIGCDHVWTATAPVGVMQLECPKCRALKGHWRFEHAPAPGTMVRQCDCGNQLFYLTTEGHMCANCGIYQRYD